MTFEPFKKEMVASQGMERGQVAFQARETAQVKAHSLCPVLCWLRAVLQSQTPNATRRSLLKPPQGLQEMLRSPHITAKPAEQVHKGQKILYLEETFTGKFYIIIN